MKKTNKLFMTGAAAALSAGLTLGVCAQTAGTSRTEDTTTGTRLPSDTTAGTRLPDTTTGERLPAVGHSTTVGTVHKSNKASGLIGMDVRNQQNEKLGDIKDIVLDLNSGKISYTVLSVGGFLGIGDKYVAVPPSAFSMSADGNELILNADKAKIQNAPGFAKDSWPDVKSSTWTADSQYWIPSTAAGTVGSLRSGSGLGSDADRIQSGTRTETGRALDRPASDVDHAAAQAVDSANRATDRATDQLDRTADRADRALDRAASDSNRTLDRAASETRTDLNRASGDWNVFKGRITKINPENRTMTVEGANGTRDFKFTEKPTLTLKDSRNPSLIDLKVGYPVSVGFHEENGTYMAHSVSRTDAPEVR